MQRIQLATLSRLSRAIAGALDRALHPDGEIACLTQYITHPTNRYILYWLTDIGQTKIIITVAYDL